MLNFVVPLFLVILCGYLFGLKHEPSAATNKTINDFVFWVALPALLFQAVARARPDELAQGAFMASALAGIGVTFVAGLLLARVRSRAPLGTAAILAMAASYGTSGYMGVPLLISLYGQAAAVPAAIATVLHNIPVIMTMVVLMQIAAARENAAGTGARAGLGATLVGALVVTVKNPLLIAVVAGAVLALARLPVPVALDQFTRFLGGAAGPTALFALGLGLSRFKVRAVATPAALGRLLPLLGLKLVLMPLVTFGAMRLFGLADPSDLLFRTALVMAALPTGAGVYVFAVRYQHNEDDISLTIVVSLLVSIVSLTALLMWLG